MFLFKYFHLKRGSNSICKISQITLQLHETNVNVGFQRRNVKVVVTLVTRMSSKITRKILWSGPNSLTEPKHC